MRIKWMIVLAVMFGLLGFSHLKPEAIAQQQVENLKNGTLLVRLHQNTATIKKLKSFYKDKEAMIMTREVREQNLIQYKALTMGYKFSEIVFFFGKDSEQIMAGNYKGVFLNSSLEIDTSIIVDENNPIFILDIGDIYFEHMSGHQEGFVILNSKFEQLAKPFPFYVRKRSGLAIIKRSELDMALILDKNLTQFYKESISTQKKRAD